MQHVDEQCHVQFATSNIHSNAVRQRSLVIITACSYRHWQLFSNTPQWMICTAGLCLPVTQPLKRRMENQYHMSFRDLRLSYHIFLSMSVSKMSRQQRFADIYALPCKKAKRYWIAFKRVIILMRWQTVSRKDFYVHALQTIRQYGVSW